MSHSHTHSHIDGHGHGHDHGHSHGHGDVSASNQEYFDQLAKKYDDLPGALEAARRIGAAIRKVYAFNEESTSVMDFACGTGAVSRELAAYAKRVVGVDISQGMVDVYNSRVANQGIPSEEMRAVRAELKGEPGELNSEKFDVIVCSMAYHHFASITDTTRVLASFLNPGGALLVADMLTSPILSDEGTPAEGTPAESTSAEGKPEELIPKSYEHAAPHRFGFDEQTMKEVFEGAGLGGFEMVEATRTKLPMGNKPVTLFVAKGVKPRDA